MKKTNKDIENDKQIRKFILELIKKLGKTNPNVAKWMERQGLNSESI